MLKYAPPILLLITGILLLSTFQGESGLTERDDLKYALEAQTKLNQELREELKSLRWKIVSLERDDLELEKEARARLRMMKPGEIVVYFEEETERGAALE